MVLPVGLGHAEFKFPGPDGIDIVDGTTGRLGRAANAVLFSILVDESADRSTALDSKRR